MKHSISRVLHPGLTPVTQSGVKPAVVKHGNTRPAVQQTQVLVDPNQDKIKNLEAQNADISRRLNDATTQLGQANQQITK
jgi:hypothetical protein